MQVMTKATAALLKPVSLMKNDMLLVSCDKQLEHFIVDVHSEWNGRKGLCSSAATNTIMRVPERKQVHSGLGMNSWQLAATDVTAMTLHALWPESQLKFYDEDAKVLFYALVAQEHVGRSIAETNAQYNEHREAMVEAQKWGVPCCHPYDHLVAAMKADVHPDPDLKLALYQRVALYNARRSDGYAEFMEQGTGKTPIVVARIMNDCRDVVPEQGLYKCIVVCPKGVRMNWEREIARFATQPGKTRVLRGLQLSRARWIVESMRREKDCKFSVLIMSYETMIRSWELLRLIEWDLAVLDESQNIKDPKAKRTKYVGERLRDRAKRRMVLTGTPIANTPLDVYSQLEFLSKGGSGFMSWKNFRKFYGVFETSETGVEALIGMQNLPFMQERLARVASIHRKKEVMPDLPDKLFDVEECGMSEEQWNVYRELATKLAAEIKNDLDTAKNMQLVVANVLTKLLRLSQVTSGYCMFDAEDDPEAEERAPRIRYDFPSVPKLERLVEMLKEKGPKEKTIVWSNWIPNIERISQRLEAEGVGHVLYHGSMKDDAREKAEWDFNHDPACRVFLGNPAAGGVGLNLLGYPPGEGDDYDTNCNHVIGYCKNWSMLQWSQGMDRAHRRGTREPVRVTSLCVPGTIDVEIHNRVEAKMETALQVSDIKEILNNLLSGLDSQDD